jgi:nicotinamidase/pyrazinamidase
VQGDGIKMGTGGEDGYSGFSVRDPESRDEEATALEGLLRRRGIERVAVAGLAADVCVKHTALDAVARGFSTTVLARATRPVDPAEGERALAGIVDAGGRIE